MPCKVMPQCGPFTADERQLVHRRIKEQTPIEVIANELGVCAKFIYAFRREAGLDGIKPSPTPSAIAARKAGIRNSWAPKQERARRCARKSEPWEVPVCGMIINIEEDYLEDTDYRRDLLPETTHY